MCDAGHEEGKKMVPTERVELPDEKCMREVNLDRYKYLGVLHLDSITNRWMKEKMKDEYIRRLKRVAQVTIKCLNVITGTNA